MTCRGTGNSSEASESVRHIVLLVGVGRVEVLLVEADLCSYSTDPTSIGVNDTSTDSNAGRKTQVGSGLFGEGADALSSSGILAILATSQSMFISSCSKRRVYHPVNASHALKVVLGKVFKTNFGKEVVLPALD